MQNSDIQKELVAKISELFALFQKQLLPQVLRQTQQGVVGLLVNSKTRQLEYDQLAKLLDMIKKQKESAQKESELLKQQLKELLTNMEALKQAGQLTAQIQAKVQQGAEQLQQKE